MSSNSRSYVTSSVSFSSSSSNCNGETTGSRYAEHTTSDPLGTTTYTASQRHGEPVYAERRDYDASGRPIAQDRSLGQGAAGGGSGLSRRIEDVSDDQRENDRLYEERIKDEYAKREGGA